MSSIRYPNYGTPTYSSASALPATAYSGALAVTIDTGNLYEYSGSAWQQIGGPSTAISLGSLDSLATSATKGANLLGGVLAMQSASATMPGLVNITTQTLAGEKTFANNMLLLGGLTVGANDSGGSITAYSIETGDLVVDAKAITLNSTGALGSGSACGLSIFENGAEFGYAKTSADKNSWELKATNTAGVATITAGASGITLDQSSHNPLTLAAVGSSPNANAASLSTQVLTLQPADATNPGVVTAGTQSFGGTKTFSSPIVGTQSQGDASTKAASTAYVDTAITNAVAGVNPAVAVQAATTQASDTSGLTYSNGVSGIGATLTGANNTALTIDGYTFTALGQRLLVKNDTQSPSGAFNGVYYVTQVQAALLPLILTRALDYDMPSDMNNTGAIPVLNGTVNTTTSWVLASLVVTVGTTPLSFTKFTRNPADYLLVSSNLSDVGTRQTALNNLTGTQTSGKYLRSDGSNATLTTIQAADVPTLNQNTSGTAAGLSATLAIASGGTGVTSVTNTATANAWAGWDSSKNLYANNFVPGYAATATSAGILTLTFASAHTQVLTGSTTHTVKMPDVSLLFNGTEFTIINESSGTVTVQSSGSNTLQTLTQNTAVRLTVVDSAAGTGTSSWNWSFSPQMASANTASNGVIRDSSGNFTAGTITAALTGTASGNTTYTANQYGVVLSGSANAMSVIAPDASTAKTLISGGTSANPSWGTLAIGGGGTGATSKATAFDALSPMTTGGDIIYGGASGTGTRLANGSNGQVLTSAGGTSAPTWTTAATANEATTINNMGLSTSVAASALTIALKQADGSTDPASGSGNVNISFRSSTVTGGGYSIRTVSAALSLVVPSGATLGFSSGSTCYAYVYLIDNAGTVELGISSAWLDEQSVQTSTAIDTSSDSNGFYSTSARTSKAIRMIARLKYTTAPNGTYSAIPDEVSLVTNPAAARITDESEAKSTGTVTFATSNQYVDVTNLVLQPGEYYLTGRGITSAVGSWSDFRYAITSTSGNSTTGMVQGENQYFDFPGTASNNKAFTIPQYRVSPTTTTTYYFKVFGTYSGTAPGVTGYIFQAQRIK